MYHAFFSFLKFSLTWTVEKSTGRPVPCLCKNQLKDLYLKEVMYKHQPSWHVFINPLPREKKTLRTAISI